MKNKHVIALALILVGTGLVGCASSLHTHVTTLSERPPAAASSYRIDLNDEQVNDLEVARIASGIHARMSAAGYVRVTDADPDIKLNFVFHQEGQTARQSSPSPSIGATHGTTVSSSQTTVGGIAVPGTRRTTVSRSSEYGVSSEPTRLPSSQQVRLELMFADDRGPSHKVTVHADSSGRTLRQVAPCLIEAAFDGFPQGDGEEVEVRIDGRKCQAG